MRFLVLTVSQSLPPAALIGSEGTALQDQISAAGGVWFQARADDVLLAGETISGWRARGIGGVGETVAQTTTPNEGASTFDQSSVAFVFKTGVHCGFTLAGAVPKITRFTTAVIFSSPDEDARSLFALNTGAANNMIFLSEADGMLFAKDRAGGIAVSLPTPPRSAARRLVILSFTGRELHLSAGGKMAIGMGLPEGLDAPADLFIGCRSNRPGLVKTLGASRIYDVMFWPDRALLASKDKTDIATLEQLHLYHRWAV